MLPPSAAVAARLAVFVEAYQAVDVGKLLLVRLPSDQVSERIVCAEALAATKKAAPRGINSFLVMLEGC
jgi:hypothetical protein